MKFIHKYLIILNYEKCYINDIMIKMIQYYQFFLSILIFTVFFSRFIVAV